MRRYNIISFLLTLPDKNFGPKKIMHIEVFTRSETLPELIEGSVLQSAFIFRIIENNKWCKPHMLVAYDDNHEEIGHIIVVKRSSFFIIPPLIKFWYIINGEGTYREGYKEREAIFNLFMEKVFEIFDFHHAYISVRNIEDSRFAYSTFCTHDFVPIRDRRLYISLHSKPPQERLSKAYRSHIRKAENMGVTHYRATSEKDITAGISLLRKYYISKTRMSLPDKKTLFAMLYEKDGTLSEKARLFIVKYKEKIIGSSMCIYDKERAYLAYCCGLRKSHPLQYPGIMAIWAALTDAHKSGYPHFDFLEARGLSQIHYNFLNTLLNYGGKQVGTFRWYHFRWNWINKILRAIYV